MDGGSKKCRSTKENHEIGRFEGGGRLFSAAGRRVKFFERADYLFMGGGGIGDEVGNSGDF